MKTLLAEHVLFKLFHTKRLKSVVLLQANELFPVILIKNKPRPKEKAGLYLSKSPTGFS
jgi:hypothetical protein